MTGPAQPASNVLQKARQRLLRLGLTDEHLLSLNDPAAASFQPTELDPMQADPHFMPLVQRVLRFLRGGRGLSIAVTDDAPQGGARVHAAMQLALGLARQGIQVVLVDMDFQHAGLCGLVSDSQSEGIIDMVRFGRSCRSVLQKPHAAGPSLLACGSFPVADAAPLDEDAVRSLLHRVSLHCELALYVAPLLPDATALNPVVRLCEHVVLVQSVSEQSVDIVDRIQLMQQARLHVAGVVLFDATRRRPAPGPQEWLPGSLSAHPSPQAPGIPATAVPFPPNPFTPPAPQVAEPGEPAPPPSAPEQPVKPAPPAPPASPASPAAPDMPSIPWSAQPAETAPRAPQAGPVEDAIPEIHLPDERAQGPFVSPGMGRGRVEPADVAPPARPTPMPTEPPSPPEAASSGESAWTQETLPEETASRGEEVIERLWAEPERTPSELEQPIASDLRRGDFEADEFEDAETEFAYDDGSNWSKTPLYILITLLVLVGGFFGWALWTKRGIEQQVGQQLSDSQWIDTPDTAQSAQVPDDAAAMPSGEEQMPSAGLQNLESPPPETTPSTTPATQDKPQRPAEVDTSTPEKDTSEMTPVPVPPPAQGKESSSGSTPPQREPPVSPSASPPRVSPPTPGSTGSAAMQYTVHVGSFRHLEQAYQDIATLQKHGFVGRAVKTDLGNKGVWYRVYVGSFATRSEAEKVRDGVLELPEYRYAQVKHIPR